jgi:hypothetical protein
VFLWPSLEYSRPLPDRQPSLRPILDRFGEQLTSFFQIVAGEKKALDLRAVLGPFLELVEIAIVRAQRVISFFVGLVAAQIRPCSAQSPSAPVPKNQSPAILNTAGL